MNQKRFPIFCLTIIFAISAVAGLLALLKSHSAHADSNILYVSQIVGCNGAAPCYNTIQSAIDAALPGDEIRVSNGVYTTLSARPRHDTVSTGSVTQTAYINKTLWLRGGFNNTFTTQNPQVYTTTLDAQGQGRGIYIFGNITPTVEGLNIINGDAHGMQGYYYYGDYDAGGGVYIITATATLSGNLVIGHKANYGGGIFLNHSNSRLEGNTISKNLSYSGGAGIAIYHGLPILVENSVISNHSAIMGGGIYVFGSNAVFTANTLANNSSDTSGGGIDVASCSPTLDRNVIAANSARNGGGVLLWYSHSKLTNNAIIDNSVIMNGEGLYLGGSEPTLLHNTFARNSGGYGNAIFVHSDGSDEFSSLAMTNTILVDHSTGISVTDGSTVTLNGVLWQNTPITISANTMFVQNQYTGSPSFFGDGYHITSASDAIDKGVGTQVSSDIDGELHLCGPADLGADEYYGSNCKIFSYLPIIIR